MPNINPKLSLLIGGLVGTDVETDDDSIFKPPIKAPYVKAELIPAN